MTVREAKAADVALALIWELVGHMASEPSLAARHSIGSEISRLYGAASWAAATAIAEAEFAEERRDAETRAIIETLRRVA